MDQLDTSAGEKGVIADEQGVGPLAHEIRESRIDLPAGAGFEDVNFQPHGPGGRLNFSYRDIGTSTSAQ